MPQETKAKSETASTHTPLQGLAATREDEQALLDALEKAFDYRGDVTLTLTDGSSVTGYIFDRRTASTLADSRLRLMPPDTDTPAVVTYDQIDRIEFTGKDAAHGKSFENWVKRYVEKKMKGETASIESEKLD
ncbi:MAG: hypothetical protein EA376_02990 [Phycisphaeraceae bacterium]|nr:MAG: hypothetical protein EA376_02990 [Phycisphaeraceae bacterium]